jgi:hypothetical protein
MNDMGWYMIWVYDMDWYVIYDMGCVCIYILYYDFSNNTQKNMLLWDISGILIKYSWDTLSGGLWWDSEDSSSNDMMLW